MKQSIIFILLILSLESVAQVRLIGSVRDSATSKVIENVHLLLPDKQGCVSNDHGLFFLKVKSLPIKVKLTHIGYHDKTVIVKHKNDLSEVFLQSKNYQLKPVTISEEVPVNIIKNSKLYVTDYDFKGDSIVLLAFKNRKNNQKQIVLLSDQGDTLKSRNLKKMDALYRDCFNNHHLLTEEFAYQLHIHDENIDFIHPTKRDSLVKTFNTIVEKIGPYYYLKLAEYSNQVVKFYIFNSLDSSLTLWRTIADEGGLERLGDKNRLQSSKGYTATDARFEEMAFYAPKFVPLVKRNDSLLLFNHVESRIEVYNKFGEEIGTVEISYHLDKKWKEELFVDDINGKLYTLYKRGGVSYLKQINALTGEIAKTVKIPEFLHVEKIKVHNDKLYFLFQDSQEYDYKQLFSMNI